MCLIAVYIGVVVVIVELAIGLSRWRLRRWDIDGSGSNINMGRDECGGRCVSWG